DDKECLFPVSPEPASYHPEEFVDGSQPWPRLLALKDGELLAKGEVFEHQTAVRPKPAKHGSEPEPKQVKHGNHVIADRLCRLPCEVVDFTAGQDCDEGQGAWLRRLLCCANGRSAHPPHWSPDRCACATRGPKSLCGLPPVQHYEPGTPVKRTPALSVEGTLALCGHRAGSGPTPDRRPANKSVPTELAYCAAADCELGPAVQPARRAWSDSHHRPVPVPGPAHRRSGAPTKSALERCGPGRDSARSHPGHPCRAIRGRQ